MTLRIPRIRVLAAALALTMVSAFAVGAATDAEADQARVTVHRVTIPAAHFIPTHSDWTYSNNGAVLLTTSGYGNFTAPIPYSYDGTDHIFITRVELLAYDNDAGSEICLDAYRAEPATGTETSMGWVCTGNTMMDPQSGVFFPYPRRINAGQRAYLWVYLGSPNVDFYGARVTYTTNP